MKTPMLIPAMALVVLGGALVARATVAQATVIGQNEVQANSSAPATPPAAPLAGGGRFAGLQKACAADFQTLCPGLTPGDGKLGPCIRQNIGKLSPQCSGALQSLRAQRGQ